MTEYVSPARSAFVPFQKFIFLFSYVELFGNDNSPSEGTVKVLAKFGNFPISPNIGGRGEESNNGITANPPTVHSILTSHPFAGSEIWG